MEIMELLLENFTTLCLALGLGILVITNKNFDKKTNRCFFLFVLIVVTLVFTGMVDDYCSGMSKPTALIYIVSATGYTLRPAAIALLMNILLRRKKSTFFIWIPILIIALISFTSEFTHLMFWFNEDNAFMRGPLTYLAHAVGSIYLVILLCLIVKMHTYITSREVFVILFSSFISVFATALETTLTGYPFLVVGAMAVSCTLYYIVLYAETFRRDWLTGLLNRKSLYLHANKKKRKAFTVISVDMNNLKEINDHHGHSAGDRALKCLADVLLAESHQDFVPYRTGGDEFILLGKGPSEECVSAFLEAARQRLKEQDLSASFGYAVCHPEDSFEEVCNRADARMYEDKKRYKHRSDTNIA